MPERKPKIFHHFPLRSVDISGLKFIQLKTDLIAARALNKHYAI
ncbi:hypothetical protein SAMN05216262_102156 [Colwellia chukchiensis]|uniref:Uncharacterized protein n=1 Tax=Colwellia chukchiensis TaxID=641665 RepID=A0A1H7J6X7_9GAMM|nr:hypothetical protein SAMN05216262_102156 [Colwellia chukchiensis]